MQTDALVLQTWPYSETSLIVHLLLPHHGAVRAIAKGARKLKGSSAASLDLFSEIHAAVRLPRRDGLAMLTAIEPRRSWLFLRQDLRRLAFAATTLEIVGALAAVSEADPWLYSATTDYLTALEGTEAPGSLTAGFLLCLLDQSGYPPRLDESLVGTPLPERMAYDFSEGTFIEERPGSASGRTMPLPRDLVQTVAATLSHLRAAGRSFSGDTGTESMAVLKLSTAHGPLALRWLIRTWEDHLHQPLKSAPFLEKILGP